MKQIKTLLALTLVSVFVLSACGGGAATEGAPESTQAVETEGAAPADRKSVV